MRSLAKSLMIVLITPFLSLSCLTSKDHKNIKNRGLEGSVYDYLSLHGHSDTESKAIEAQSFDVLSQYSRSLNLAENEIAGNGKKDVLICAKAQMAILIKGGGAICKSKRYGKLKSVSIFGAGLDQGFEAGVLFLGYVDFSEKQIYRGFEVGYTVVAGLTAAYASNRKHGKLWLFSRVV